MELDMTTILDASSRQFYVGSSSNQGMINNDMALELGYDVPSMMAPPPAYNIIDPEVNDILDVAGFGGYNVNPRGNDNLDSLDMVLKGFEDGFKKLEK
ncbi:hypothetical protein V6N11_057181 [Hibiscus sabdariffa]|uniref:Uncharacterized protein n=1 Tax=Hibiscus sabdariffa TaxID=183260 RepID=A0ABR2NK80_9ROSI